MTRDESVNFSAAEISIIVHATEDKDKILEQLDSTLSVSPDSFSIGFAEGHWGNKIVLLTSVLDKKEANYLYVKIRSCLSDNDVALLSNFYDEKGNLFVRLDKQRVCSGKVSLSEADSVRIKFKPILTHEHRRSTLNRMKT
ncbi:MAG TPA: RNA-binding domain-containing protein [Candidatus Nitrosopolaris sp.]|nr:RNA-binding domain-containing protein [Candidatus Nitrosopolaris sp.]